MEADQAKTAEADTYYRLAMKGRLINLPPEESSAIKIFFSSTFTGVILFVFFLNHYLSWL
jgi:hypothetical protein